MIFICFCMLTNNAARENIKKKYLYAFSSILGFISTKHGLYLFCFDWTDVISTLCPTSEVINLILALHVVEVTVLMGRRFPGHAMPWRGKIR